MLKGKNIVITGGNRGIGREIVEKCMAEGAGVWLCTRTISHELTEWIDTVSIHYKTKIRLVQMDLSDEDSIKCASKEILAYKIPINGIVNNAGMTGPIQLFSMMSMEDIRKTFETNFFGPSFFTQRLLKNMIKNKQGAIVNVASVAALDGEPAQYAYVTSKAAVIGATKRLANELGSMGIRVNAVAPGMIDTDMGEQIDEKKKAGMLAITAMNRLGNAHEVANMIAFLLSDDASYITGQIIRVDGGKV